MPTTPECPEARVLTPDHASQALFVPFDAAVIPDDHRARWVWMAVSSLDLAPLYEKIRSREGSAGRPAIDPRLLFALWVLALLDGVDSGRQLARLTRESLPYRWLCGGVHVDYHTLNDFRAENGETFGRVLVHSVTGLIREGVVRGATIAQDGMRLRASAGNGTFRSGNALRKARAQAEAMVAEKLAEWSSGDHEDPPTPPQRRAKARLEAKAERLKRAVEESEALDKTRTERGKSGQPDAKKRAKIEKSLENGSRVSTTDPDARIMHMPDNGFRPAHSVQLAAAEEGFIVGVFVTAEGSDAHQIPPMLDQLARDYPEMKIENGTADGGFRNDRTIEELYRRGIRACIPLKKNRELPAPGAETPAKRGKPEPEWRSAWVEFMSSDEGKAMYAKRGQLVEFPFAFFRNQGLTRVRVRGQERVSSVVLLHAITYNLRRRFPQQAA